MLGRFARIFSGFRIWDTAVANVARAGVMLAALLLGWALSGFRIWGTFRVVVLDPMGNVKAVRYAPNSVVNTGLNYILNVALGGGTQITTWYVGLVNNASFTAFAAGDTHAVHAGWIEATGYSQTNRVTWSGGTSTAQSITNASSANFSMNASATIKGLFISNDNTKGGTASNTLFSEAAFSGGNQSVNSGDTLQVTYTCNAASS
jgi:hypothetical protein